jgi:hypothetical protein
MAPAPKAPALIATNSPRSAPVKASPLGVDVGAVEATVIGAAVPSPLVTAVEPVLGLVQPT